MEENEKDFELTVEMKVILDELLMDDVLTYLTAEESLEYLSQKYRLEIKPNSPKTNSR